MSEPSLASVALEGASGDLSLVIVSGGSLHWGLPSSAVLSVHTAADWLGAAPLDWDELVGAGARTDSEHVRVLLLKTERAELAVRVRGAIQVATVSASEVLPLPTHLLGSGVRAAQGICFAAAGPPLLVMNVNRIGHNR